MHFGLARLNTLLIDEMLYFLTFKDQIIYFIDEIQLI